MMRLFGPTLDEAQLSVYTSVPRVLGLLA
jgi:hypothetical protein